MVTFRSTNPSYRVIFRTVNPLAYAFNGSNPFLPTILFSLYESSLQRMRRKFSKAFGFHKRSKCGQKWPFLAIKVSLNWHAFSTIAKLPLSVNRPPSHRIIDQTNGDECEASLSAIFTHEREFLTQMNPRRVELAAGAFVHGIRGLYSVSPRLQQPALLFRGANRPR